MRWRADSRRVVRGAVVLSAAMTLGGCATVQKTYDSWFGETPPTSTSRTTTTSGAGEEARVYYAGRDEMTVHSEPSSSSKILGKLALHEKVIRTRLDRGYALVRSADRELQGWVVNANLIWRLPKTSGREEPSAAEAPPEEPSAAEPEAEETPEEGATTAEPAATPAAEQAAPAEEIAPTPTAPTGAAPSIFDAY